MNGKYKLQYQRDNRINHVGTDRVGSLHIFCLHQKQAENKRSIRDGGFTDQPMLDLRGIRAFKSLQLERVAKPFTANGSVCRSVFDGLDGQEIFKNIRHCSKAGWN